MSRSIQIILIVTSLGFSGCSDETQPGRTYRMGMANSAPRFDNLDLFIQSLNLWTQRADAAIISTEVPWEELLGGMKPKDYAIANYQGLVDFYRDKDLELWIYIDPQNGLDRSSDALELQVADKSIADVEIQALYKKFAFVMDSIFHPEHMGLALETNLIRDAASESIYNGVKQAANDAAAEIRAHDPKVKLSVSVQVDHAWGKLVGGSFTGVEQDFTDFAFIEELGLSSYPYFGFDSPAEIPENYYSRIVDEKNLPVFVSEGGWSSSSVSTPDISFVSSPQIQEEYIKRHATLLTNANAIAVFQLTFTDIDLSSLPPDVPENIGYFAYLGLVDDEFNPKPALSAWDLLFTLPLQD
ncbi:MAG: hypothetical protein WAZ98_12735 [Cyclobacteriaceae bacterium]